MNDEEILDAGQWEALCDAVTELGAAPVVYKMMRQADRLRAENDIRRQEHIEACKEVDRLREENRRLVEAATAFLELIEHDVELGGTDEELDAYEASASRLHAAMGK